MLKGKRFVVLTGPPGIGKTTVIQKIVELIPNEVVAGFFTKEVRDKGTRIGFDVVSLDGKQGTLARVTSVTKGPSVGKYTVDVPAFESIALPSLNISASLLVIDEIGKMELFSDKFKKKVGELILSKKYLLVTIPVEKGNPVPLLTSLRSSPYTQIFVVSRSNRDGLPEEIAKLIKESLAEQ